MTRMARTTCHSFSTRPASVPSAAATCSTRFRSSTFEAQVESVVADLAADTLTNADHTARRHLRRAARVIVLHGTARQGFDADALQRLPQGRETFRRDNAIVERGFDGAGV